MRYRIMLSQTISGETIDHMIGLADGDSPEHAVATFRERVKLPETRVVSPKTETEEEVREPIAVHAEPFEAASETP